MLNIWQIDRSDIQEEHFHSSFDFCYDITAKAECHCLNSFFANCKSDMPNLPPIQLMYVLTLIKKRINVISHHNINRTIF